VPLTVMSGLMTPQGAPAEDMAAVPTGCQTLRKYVQLNCSRKFMRWYTHVPEYVAAYASRSASLVAPPYAAVGLTA
jgi:hypothetical protein